MGRGEQNKQQKIEDHQDLKAKQKNKKRTFETLVAKQVWHCLVDTLHPHHTTFGKRMENMGKAISIGQKIRGAPSVFLPGRMAFEFDTELEQGPQDIPRIVYAAKEDAPSVDNSTKVAALLPQTVAKVRDAFYRALEERKRRKLDKTSGGGPVASHVVQKAAVGVAVKYKAKDADDNIFGDAGSYADTVKDISDAAKQKARRAAKKQGIVPEGSTYFDDAGAAKYQKAPEGQIDLHDMVVEEKEGDEVGTAEEQAKADFEPVERFEGPRKGRVFKLGTQGLGYYREKEVSTSAAALAEGGSRKSLRSKAAAQEEVDDDAYGECFPSALMGNAGVTTLDEDSDEEDGKKRKLGKKGEEEKEGEDNSYGKKAKGVPKDDKKKKQSEDQQWQKIEKMMKKGNVKSVGELEGERVGGGRSAPKPRELPGAYF